MKQLPPEFRSLASSEDSCNGERIKEIRNQRGWTQVMLAKKAGYSERLIRKAESGRRVDRDSLAAIADALSTDETPVSIEELIHSPLSLVRRYVELFMAEGEQGIIDRGRQLFSKDFRCWVAGNPDVNPCAGDWDGADGLVRYFQTLKTTFETLEFDPHYASFGDQVFVHGVQRLRVVGHTEEAVVWGVNQYMVRDQKIVLWKNHYDTAVCEHLLRRAKDAS